MLTVYLGANHIDVDLHGFDAAGAPGNLDAIHHFDSAQDLRKEIIDARLWGGVHYRFSSEVGVELGRSVAKYDLRHAFRPLAERFGSCSGGAAVGRPRSPFRPDQRKNPRRARRPSER